MCWISTSGDSSANGSAPTNSRAPQGVTEAERFLLAGKACRAWKRQFARQKLDDLAALSIAKGILKLDLTVEMVLDDVLIASGHEDEVFNASLAGLIDDMLNERPIDHRQHLFGHSLGDREKSRTEASDRENCFAYAFQPPLLNI